MDEGCTIYLIRHGATRSNLERPPRLQGRGVNYGLCKVGRQQARQAGRLLAPLSLAAVYSSPMLRSVETAEIIASSHNLHVEMVADLHEVDVGEWEGRGWDEIERDYPDQHRLFFENPAEHGYVGGETLDELLRRILPCFEQIAADHPGHEVAVVAHSVVNRTLITHLLNLPMQFNRRISQQNGAVNVIRANRGQLKVKTVNSTFHLRDD